MNWPRRIAFGTGLVLMFLFLMPFVFGNFQFIAEPAFDETTFSVSEPLWFVLLGLSSWLALTWLIVRERNRPWLVLLVPVGWAVATTFLALRICDVGGVFAACMH